MCQHKEVITAPNYTIYIPNSPRRMAIYLHALGDFPHSNGRKGNTLYNFQEEVAEGIFNTNPNTIVVAAKYDKKVQAKIIEIVTNYNLKDVIISGWSLGGNDAVSLTGEFYKKTDICPKLLLIDSNHTNQFDDKTIAKIQKSKTYYVSNVLSKAKTKHISKIVNNGLSVVYLLVCIPYGFEGSNHRYCRDSAIDNNLYGFIFDGRLKGDYTICHWDPDKGEFVI